MWDSAQEELDGLGDEEKATLDVMHLRLTIYVGLGRFEAGRHPWPAPSS